MRTDENNNPTAFTTDVARQAGLELDTDYEAGTPFEFNGKTYYTAKLLGDPINLTLTIISRLSFYINAMEQRWTYIGMPNFVWDLLNRDQQISVIGFMYQREGGTAMRNLFPNYGKK